MEAVRLAAIGQRVEVIFLAWEGRDMYHVHFPVPLQALQTSILPKPSQTMHSTRPWPARPIMICVPQ